MPADIASRTDIETLMRHFYSIAISDAEIGHHFDDLDLDAHIPVIVDFWEKALFAKPVYFNNPLAVHQKLHDEKPMTPRHFARWVEIFAASVDELFTGEVAEGAKAKARLVADSFDQRLNTDKRFSGLDIARLTR